MPQEPKIIAGLIIATAFFLMAVFFVIALLAYYHKRKKALLYEQRAILSSYENELLKTRLEVQEQTLHVVSQEIHDNIGQSLSFIKLNVALINLDDRGATEQKLSQTNQELARTIQDLRDLSKTLSPDYIGKAGLISGITRQMEILKRTGLYQIAFEINGKNRDYPPHQELILYRILQEILNNTVKHAKAGSISLQLNYHDDHLSVDVSDDGVGFDPELMKNAEIQGLGLSNITSRMKLIGGTAVIESRPGQGTHIRLQLPVTE